MGGGDWPVFAQLVRHEHGGDCLKLDDLQQIVASPPVAREKSQAAQPRESDGPSSEQSAEEDGRATLLPHKCVPS
ncbi:MAG: hypothetical protein SGPRY_011558 [Prymnesium sp.]